MRLVLFFLISLSFLFSKAQPGFHVGSQTPNLNVYDFIYPTSLTELENGNFLIGYWNRVDQAVRPSGLFEYNQKGKLYKIHNSNYLFEGYTVMSLVEIKQDDWLIEFFDLSGTGSFPRGFAASMDTVLDTNWTTHSPHLRRHSYSNGISLGDSVVFATYTTETIAGGKTSIGLAKLKVNGQLEWKVDYDSVSANTILPSNSVNNSIGITNISMYNDTLYTSIRADSGFSYLFALALNNGALGSVKVLPNYTFKAVVSSGRLVCFHHKVPYTYSRENLWDGFVSMYTLTGANLLSISPQDYMGQDEYVYRVGCLVDSANEELVFLFGKDDLRFNPSRKNLSSIGVLRLDFTGAVKQKIATVPYGGQFSLEPLEAILTRDSSVAFTTTRSSYEGLDSYFFKVKRNQQVMILPEWLMGNKLALDFFPNPISSGESLTLEGLVQNKTAEIRILNSAGSLVQETSLPPYANQQLPINLAKGFYQIEVRQNEEINLSRLVVK